MNKKAFVLVLMLISLIGVLAYSAGAKSQQLSNKEINVNDLTANQHGNQLLASMRDRVVGTLDTLAKNHEARLQVFAGSPGYPNLTAEETSYTSLLSSNNGNQLTAQMRDGLLNKLTAGMTNHEMRIRALENKPATPPAAQYRCVGEYQDGSSSVCVEDQDAIGPNIGWRDEYGYRCTASSDPFNKGSCSPKSRRGIRYRNQFIGCSSAEWRTENGTITYSCGLCRSYDGNSCPNDTYCQKVSTPIMKDCSIFSQTACTTKPGCRREKA